MSNRVTLPAGTTLGKSFEHGLDINLGTYAAPLWQPLRRMSGYQPTFPSVKTDVATYDDLGSPNEDVTGRGYAASLTVQGNRSLNTGLYLPELEAIMYAAKHKGEDAVIDVRWYHKPEKGVPNPVDAGRVLATVDISRSNTDNAGIEVYSVSIAGKGEFEEIPNPFTGWGATAPIVAAVSPDGIGSGDLVTITGSGLLGATAVTFDTIASADFLVVDAATIIAALPTDDAGTVPVVVTTPGGVSTPASYERGA